MKVFNSPDLDWRSARRNLARAFYHSSDFDSIQCTYTPQYIYIPWQCWGVEMRVGGWRGAVLGVGKLLMHIHVAVF